MFDRTDLTGSSRGSGFGNSAADAGGRVISHLKLKA
jgi:hypothetical protein